MATMSQEEPRSNSVEGEYEKKSIAPAVSKLGLVFFNPKKHNVLSGFSLVFGSANKSYSGLYIRYFIINIYIQFKPSTLLL